MSPTQQKLMQYLPVFFAVFQVFFLAALVVYYIFQTIIRIGQQFYITKVFYGHDEALGRQAQRAGEQAREEARKQGDSGGGLFAQAKRELAAGRGGANDSKDGKGPKAGGSNKREVSSKRVTPPKNKETPSGGSKGRPTPSRQESRAKRSSRPKSSGKKRSSRK